MSSREKDQADFDLERVFDLFDTALTSRDERVVNALRSLLMITALTASEANEDADQVLAGRTGPLRRMRDDIDHLTRSINRLDGELNQIKAQMGYTGGAGISYPYSVTGIGGYGPAWTLGAGGSSGSVSLTPDEHDVILDYRNNLNTTQI